MRNENEVSRCTALLRRPRIVVSAHRSRELMKPQIHSTPGEAESLEARSCAPTFGDGGADQERSLETVR